MNRSQALMQVMRVAILHQGGPVPSVGGTTKPMKPGGYADSSADLAYNLRQAGVDVLIPVQEPDPVRHLDWSFKDDETSILDALSKGANVLWANTVLHSQHPLALLPHSHLDIGDVRMVGQNPNDVERYDDKQYTNAWLAQQPGLEDAFPRSWLVTRTNVDEMKQKEAMGLVVKPIRGRGSHGVTKVSSVEDRNRAIDELLKEDEGCLVEEYLSGEEITITVMPPGDYDTVGKQDKHWSLPVITRFNHINGIAPYNGVVAVTANSRLVSPSEHSSDPSYSRVQAHCARAAELLVATAPIRIDCRRRSETSDFVLFDVNMKPNATGPGRPGREDQASLTTMAAAGLGWDYKKLISNIVRQAKPLSEIVK